MIKEGTIIKNISNVYTVISDNKEFDCKARGKFRKENIIPLVGDNVLFDEEKLYLLEIMPRSNELQRPNVANVDIALIVTSLKEPDLSLNLLDKLISMVIINKVIPIICLTKEDLLSEEEKTTIKDILTYYEKIGIKVFYNYEKEKILSELKNKIVVLTGQTGAGKSSLLNKLDENLNLKTSPISQALGRGVHTTRHSELFKISDIWFLDTPGFSALDLNIYNEEQIRNSFSEFKNYTCLYRDCSHIKTDGCEVLKAVLNKNILTSRYNSYCSFIKELKKGE